jgi:N6-adenosine-specific RNA methylase IME4
VTLVTVVTQIYVPRGPEKGCALFAPLPTVPGGFGAVCPDPPWKFASNSDARPGRNPSRHYRCLTPAELMTLPLADVMAPDSYCFLWVTGPHLAIGDHLAVLRAWGFKPTAMGFTWIKLNRRFAAQPSLFWTSADLFLGTGRTLRRNAEFMVLGRRGKPKRLAADVFEIVIAPVREHSRKPDEVYDRIRGSLAATDGGLDEEERRCESARYHTDNPG